MAKKLVGKKKLRKAADKFAEDNWNGKYTSKEDVASIFLVGAAEGIFHVLSKLEKADGKHNGANRRKKKASRSKSS